MRKFLQFYNYTFKLWVKLISTKVQIAKVNSRRGKKTKTTITLEDIANIKKTNKQKSLCFCPFHFLNITVSGNFADKFL